MTPGERLPKAARKDHNLSLLKFQFCSSAKDQNPQNQGKPHNGEAPAKDQEKELGRATQEGAR